MLNMSYSVADQNFQTTVSTGIYGLSMGLVNALDQCDDIDRLAVFVNRFNVEQVGSNPKTVHMVYDLPVRSTAGRLLWDHWQVYEAAKRTGNEWLFLPKGYASGCVRSPVKLAVYLHDIMPIVFGDRYPDFYSKRKQAYFRHVYRMTFKHADVIFTNTAFTKSELQNWASAQHLNCPQIEVAGYGFDHLKSDAVIRSKEDYILVFTRRSPHKRTDLAIDYLQRWKQKTSYQGNVVCVGGLDERLCPRDQKGWHFHDRMEFGKLWQLMLSARAVVHFTEYEGFGMPPPEAVMAGTVPVFSNIPPLLEVMRGTGLSFANASYDSFETAMEQAFRTESSEIATWRQILLSQHNWSHVVDSVTTRLKQMSGSP